MTRRLSTTVVVGALDPKIPPFVGDAPGTPRPTVAVGTALIPKLPPFQGE
jgi:hypothetical protein